MSIDRRDFLTCIGLSSATAVVCTTFSEVAHAKGRVFAITLDQAPKLKQVGGWTILDLKGIQILLIRASAKQVRAFDPTCTHKRCLVGFDKGRMRIACGCHKSQFRLQDGRPIGGPATKPLKQYKTRLRGDKLLIKVG
ncbi:MAG: Rieske (2Fe-2S) protein [bacterium]